MFVCGVFQCISSKEWCGRACSVVLVVCLDLLRLWIYIAVGSLRTFFLHEAGTFFWPFRTSRICEKMSLCPSVCVFYPYITVCACKFIWVAGSSCLNRFEKNQFVCSFWTLNLKICRISSK